MTEEEFEAWCTDDTRAEFVDGKVIQMSPTTIHHNDIIGFLWQLLGVYLAAHPRGRVTGPEYQVRLRSGLRRVPDLLFIAAENGARIRKTILEGAPDAAWEVVSQDSVERDWREKYDEYEASGVREYWVIDPLTENVRLYYLTESGYEAVEPQDGRLHSKLLPGFCVKTEWFWQDPLPNLIECLRELGLFVSPLGEMTGGEPANE